MCGVCVLLIFSGVVVVMSGEEEIIEVTIDMAELKKMKVGAVMPSVVWCGVSF